MAEEFLTVDWYPEPVVIAEELDHIGVMISNFTVPLTRSVPVVGEQIKQIIEDGDFVEWQPSYAKRVEKDVERGDHTGLMLQKSRDLVNSVANKGNYAITSTTLDWTGNAAPKYAEEVHFGAPTAFTSGPRNFIGLTEEGEAEVYAIFYEWLDEVAVWSEAPVIGELATGQPIHMTEKGPRFGPKIS